MRSFITKHFDSINKQLKDIPPLFRKVQVVNNVVSSFQKRISILEEKIAAGDSALKCDNDNLDELKQTVFTLENEIIELKCEARRKNLLFFGITEFHGENTSDVIKNFLYKNLKLKNPIPSMEYIQRIGYKRLNANRPILVKFYTMDDRIEIYLYLYLYVKH